MNIKCPQCGFSKDVSPTHLQGKNIFATCPKCGSRFPVKKIRNTHSDSANSPEEEDIRLVASRAYKREAERFEHESKVNAERNPNKMINPWDLAPGDMGWIASFYQTCLHILFYPAIFFSHLKSRTRMEKALAFYLIVIAVQILTERMWGQFFLSILGPDAINDPQLEKMLTILSSESNLLLTLLLRGAMLLVQLYVFTFLLFLAYRLMAPGQTTFALVFQILTYSAAPGLLCVIPVVGSIAGFIWSFVCLLCGIRSALSLDWARTIIGFLPIIFLLAPVFVQLAHIISQ